MLLTLEPEDPRPLYAQITSAIRHQIRAGDLTPGTRLPSGRDLAAVLDVNLETVQRAYRDLTSDGYLVSRVGRGTTVANDPPSIPSEVLAAVDAAIDAAIRHHVDRTTVGQLLADRWPD